MLVILFSLMMSFAFLYFLYMQNYEYSKVVAAVYFVFLIVLFLLHPEHTKSLDLADRILDTVSNSRTAVVLDRIAQAMLPLYESKPLKTLLSVLPEDREYKAMIVFALSILTVSIGVFLLPRRPKPLYVPLAIICIALSLIVFIYPFLLALNYTNH